MSASFGEKKPHISSVTEACLCGTLVLAILVCQSKAAEKQVFTFLHDPFMEVTMVGLLHVKEL